MVNLLIPAPGGAPRLIYGWDGTDWRACAVTALGELEVGVVASALPAGAATAAQQALMLGQLQLIEDLRAALNSVGTDELDVIVEESVLPTGAATAAHQVTQNTALALIEKLEKALESVATDRLVVINDTLPDLRYQGDNVICELDTVSVATATLTRIGEYTVPAGKKAYITGWGLSFDGEDEYFFARIQVEGAQKMVLTGVNSPLQYQGQCIAVATATQRVWVYGEHSAVGNLDAYSYILGFVEAA